MHVPLKRRNIPLLASKKKKSVIGDAVEDTDDRQ